MSIRISFQVMEFNRRVLVRIYRYVSITENFDFSGILLILVNRDYWLFLLKGNRIFSFFPLMYYLLKTMVQFCIECTVRLYMSLCALDMQSNICRL